jgi:hypothetical protein
LYEVADDLPCADFGLLKLLKRSPQYAAIRKRVARPKPVDAWQAHMVHYFVFELKPVANGHANTRVPFALFSLRWENDGPAKALVVTPDKSGTHVEVENLLQPGVVQTVPLKEPN